MGSVTKAESSNENPNPNPDINPKSKCNQGREFDKAETELRKCEKDSRRMHYGGIWKQGDKRI